MAPERALAGQAFNPGWGEVATRVKRLRTMRGLHQAELAELAGTTQTTISHFEQGRIEPTEELISGLASSFGVTASFLTSRFDLEPPTRPWLRAYADASKREADARTAFAVIATEYIHRLQLDTRPDNLPGAPVDAEDDEQIEDIADEARQIAGLEPGAVVPNAVRAAERLGCIVLPAESELGRHVGMSLRSNALPVICVANAGIPGDRQRFTVCHELGHLILHGALRPPGTSDESSRMERQANRFAAAFLTPGDALIETLEDNGGRVTLQALSKVKAVWGVAIKSLVGRYRSLGVIDDDQARSLYKQISARRWTKVEPVDVPNESAQWFAGSMTRRVGIKDLRTAAAVLAERIGGNVDDLMAFADWSGPADAEVVDLASRRR